MQTTEIKKGRPGDGFVDGGPVFTPVPDLIPFTLQPAPAGDPAPAFTLGRWEVRHTGNQALDLSIFVDGARPSSGCICKVPHRDGFSRTQAANAALIAAAPDLYFAARVALDKLEHLPGQSAVAVAALASAIRKAEGRS